MSTPDSMTEWRNVPDWPGYQVSDDGRVMQTAGKYAPLILTQNPSTTPKWNRWPYACVRLSKLVDGKKFFRHVRVHRAVMAAFVGPRLEGMEVHHRDGDHWNNRLDNLEYVTKQVNEDYAQPLRPRGSRHHRAKLTEDQVRQILALAGKATERELGAKFGVTDGCIHSIHASHVEARCMTEPIKFPDEPIRVVEGPNPMTHGGYIPLEDRADDLVDPDERNCQTCGGDGFVFCDGDEPMCPEADDSGCYMHHAIRCWNCRGTGAAKDQWFW